MSSEKRLVLCLFLTIATVFGLQFLMERAGLIQRPKPAVAKGGDPARPKDGDPAQAKGQAPPVPKDELPADPFHREPAAVAAAGPAKVGPKLARPDELVLGSDEDGSPAAYHLKVQLRQRGAAVARATAAAFDAEFDRDKPGQKPGRLALIQENPKAPDAPGSLAIMLMATKGNRPAGAEGDPAAVIEAGAEAPLDLETWEVVRDRDDAPAVRAITKTDPRTKAVVEGQEVAFRARSQSPRVDVTKVFRLWKGEDGFEVDLKFRGDVDARFSYRLIGPYGIPIEGEWYTSTFRDVFFGGATDANGTTITTRTAYDAVKYRDDPAQRITQLPLKFAGVEDQYFATLVQPWPIPRSQDDRRDQDADSIVIRPETDIQKSDVGVAIHSRPIVVGPNLGEVAHSYRVFAGPKATAALLPYEADELASYRKNQWFTIPFAATLAKNVIAPLLDHIYALTASLARACGWVKGNYGISIILLTMFVRLAMFPVGRKQAQMAQKMQNLQPILAEVKEKYKDDKEALTRETMAVWKRNKVNPAAGCLPALIQMPIFVGLWQSLNNSVALRHSSFLYIRDLAAPDMLFKFPFEVPFLGNYFNLLPFLVVALMLVQTKLFAPPPTTPEAEMNQKMMKYMMVFMAVMFYKVPSGLGLYFITSSTWQICERLLLPKVTKPVKPATEDDFGGRGPGPGGGGPNGNGNGNGGGAQGWLGKRLEKLLDEAAKDKTIRNANVGDRSLDRSADRDRDRNRPPRPNKPPGKRR